MADFERKKTQAAREAIELYEIQLKEQMNENIFQKAAEDFDSNVSLLYFE